MLSIGQLMYFIKPQSYKGYYYCLVNSKWGFDFLLWLYKVDTTSGTKTS